VTAARPTIERLREVLDYDPETGVLRWRVQPNGRVPIGSIAGCVSPTDGYLMVQIDGFRTVAHRVAWAHTTGYWPTNDIDHRNGVRTENRFRNLREGTRQNNCWNRKKGKSNTSGFKGVYQDRMRFAAQITKDGCKRYLGSFATAEEAHAAYVSAARESFGEFARAE
jgi:HNH endonuclease/AP2 domain